jgi:hypothetical protein
VFDSCQLAIPLLRHTLADDLATQPAIVNVASLDAVTADRGFAAYNAATAGVLDVTPGSGSPTRSPPRSLSARLMRPASSTAPTCWSTGTSRRVPGAGHRDVMALFDTG